MSPEERRPRPWWAAAFAGGVGIGLGLMPGIFGASAHSEKAIEKPDTERLGRLEGKVDDIAQRLSRIEGKLDRR